MRSFDMRNRAILGLVVAFGLMVGAAACGTDSGSEDDASPGASGPSGTLRLATSIYTTAEPFPYATTTSGDFGVLSLIYEGLVQLDGDGRPNPLLAESWETSDDGKTITFSLLDGVQFADGSEFNADAVKSNLDFVLSGDDRVNPGVSGQIAAIESTEVISDLEVAVHLSEPAQLEVLIGLGWHAGLMVSPNALPPGSAQPLVGTGPYVFNNDGTPADYSMLAFTVNDAYRNPEAVTLEAIEVTMMPDRAALASAYNASQFDVVVAYPSMGDVQDGDFVIGASPATGLRIDASDRHNPALANRDVRCALRQALDKPGFIQLQLQSPDTVLDQWAADDTEYAWIDDLDVPAFDLDEARAALDAQGVTNLELTAAYAPDPSGQDLLTLWAGALREIGVTLTPQALESGAQLYAALGESRFPIAVEYWTTPHPLLTLAQAAASDGALSGVAEAPQGVDDLIASARGKSHEDAEADIAAAYKIMLEECILGPVIRQQPGFWVHSNVTGFEPLSNPTSWDPLGVQVDGN